MGSDLKSFSKGLLAALTALVVGFFIGNSRPIFCSLDNISKIFTIFFSFAGLCLGFFYYIAKVNHDSDVSKLNRIRQRLDVLLNYLEIIEKNFYAIINGNFDSDGELETLNDIIDNNLFNIQIFIEKNETLLLLPDEDLKMFSELHSFYEGASIVFGSDHSKLKKLFNENTKLRAEHKSTFNRYLNNFKRVCIHRGE